jgi:hypothetical protein
VLYSQQILVVFSINIYRKNNIFHYCTVRSECRCSLVKVVGSDVHERLTDLIPLHFIRKHFLQICVVLNFNRCLTSEHSEITAHFNGNFGTDNQIYVLLSKCTATFRTHCIIRQACCFCDRATSCQSVRKISGPREEFGMLNGGPRSSCSM